MINISNLNFSYKKKTLFSNLSLELKAGNIYGLLGKNGAGKTTLLKIISGLLFPDKGQVEAAGFVPSLRKPDFLKEVFFLPEEYNLPGLKIAEYKKIYAPFYSSFNNDKFEELLEEFQLPSNLKLSSLSYGQKKKFLISFGIACNSRLFLLDEPTNGLDIPSKTQFRKIIASAGSESRLIIISTHQVRDMENLIDPIIIINEGQVIFNQSMEQVADTLTVKKTAEEPEKGTVFYTERELDGYISVLAGNGEDTAGMELEMLFNTVITNPSEIQSLFKGEHDNETR